MKRTSAPTEAIAPPDVITWTDPNRSARTPEGNCINAYAIIKPVNAHPNIAVEISYVTWSVSNNVGNRYLMNLAKNQSNDVKSRASSVEIRVFIWLYVIEFTIHN